MRVCVWGSVPLHPPTPTTALLVLYVLPLSAFDMQMNVYTGCTHVDACKQGRTRLHGLAQLRFRSIRGKGNREIHKQSMSGQRARFPHCGPEPF